MSRQCLFCPQPADSKEHLWSDWILKELKPTEPIRFTLGKTKIKWIDNPEVLIKCVCYKCNNTWMNNIETENKLHMLPMLRGLPITLESLQQKSLARWAILKAMVLEAADRQRVPFYGQDERRDLKPPSLAIPVGTYVWVGRLSKLGYHTGSTGIFRPLENVPKAIHGLVTTIIVGHLAIQVLTLHVPPMFANSVIAIEDNPWKWDVSLLDIWPVFGAVRWPPPVSFTLTWPNSIGRLVFRWKVGTDIGT